MFDVIILIKIRKYILPHSYCIILLYFNVITDDAVELSEVFMKINPNSQ